LGGSHKPGCASGGGTSYIKPGITGAAYHDGSRSARALNKSPLITSDRHSQIILSPITTPIPTHKSWVRTGGSTWRNPRYVYVRVSGSTWKQVKAIYARVGSSWKYIGY
jgi:hypothetical protein